jgi:hypothetical protein
MASHRGFPRTVTAAAVLTISAETAYEFLSHLPNHARIAGRRLRVESLATERLGGRIAIRGPLGLRRTAVTTITYLTPPVGVGGTADVGRSTTGQVDWEIRRLADGCRVTLTATILRVGVLDRVLFGMGGRWWLTRGFERAIVLLGEVAAIDGTQQRSLRKDEVR